MTVKFCIHGCFTVAPKKKCPGRLSAFHPLDTKSNKDSPEGVSPVKVSLVVASTVGLSKSAPRATADRVAQQSAAGRGAAESTSRSGEANPSIEGIYSWTDKTRKIELKWGRNVLRSTGCS